MAGRLCKPSQNAEIRVLESEAKEKRMTLRHRGWRLIGFLIVLRIFGGVVPASAGEALPVFVSILPQKYFVEQVGGGHVAVSVMVAPGASPATYEPKPRQMAALAAAKAYFAVGVPFEAAWLPRIQAANPQMRVVDTAAEIVKRPMAAHAHEGDADHDHYHDADPHVALDPHVWLSPSLVKIQARAIRDALVALDPIHQADYDAGLGRFAQQIDDLDHELRETFAGREGMGFMVFHPSWGYFADAYGLEQIPIEIEGKDPKPAQLQELIKTARSRDIRVIFVQPQFSGQSAATVAAAIGGAVLPADPLAPDWADNLRRQAAQIRGALR
jgi:zinc transport system substrate-binding protein